MWDIDANGNVVWREGAGRQDVEGRVLGFLPAGGALGQQILESRAAGGGGFFAPSQQATNEAIVEAGGRPPSLPLRNRTRDNRVAAARLQGLADEILGVSQMENVPVGGDGGLDLTGLFGPDAPLGPAGPAGVPTGPGYAPSLVDTAAAEALLRYEQTPEERAALEQLLQDLEFRAEAGTAAVRTGWQDVQAINGAAAQKAARMAQQAGPDAARLWIDAANTALNLSAQAAEVLATTPGMQRVNISPSAGSERIAALLAAQAPRAQALAERMGLASAEEIAAQARTAGMMGEAYAGEIQRTALIQASQARQAHNAQVLERTARERQMGAEMRFGAAQTNAQLLSQAAAQAASGARDPQTARERTNEFIADVRNFANADPLDAAPTNGIALLRSAYPWLDPEAARNFILGARSGTIDFDAAQAGAIAAAGG
jgi:hypothetical protein